MSDQTAASGYIHGYSDDEAQRLLDQAEFLAPWVLDGVSLDNVGKLLEVGVGVGAETRLLRRRWPGTRVIGVDISEGQLRHARRVLADDVAAGDVELVRASGTSMPLRKGLADGAFICWVLEHVPDPAAVLRECARVVRPGGPVFVTEVYNASLAIEPAQPLIQRYWSTFNEAQRAAGGHPNIGARLGELAVQAGLEVVSHRFVPVLGDGRDPVGRLALLRYFQTLLRSAAPQLLAAGAFTEAEVAKVWETFAALEATPDALLCYTMAKLEARVR
jgi:SAM-dependent methyltransferase